MNTSIYRRILLFILLGASFFTRAGETANAQAEPRCFGETGYCIAGRIREFWEQNGGLSVFGFPVTPQVRTRIEGLVVPVQWFERARLEVHAENIRPYDVQLGRLGAESLELEIRDPEWSGFRPGKPQSGCRFFAETQHNVCGDFLKAWQAHGFEFDGHPGASAAESLALFGLPLTEPTREMLRDGHTYLVQWFERARFELHPENPAPYNVLLGLLGSELPIAEQRPILQRTNPPLRGYAVFELQQLLSDLGYDVGPIDGIYGAETEAGVRNFQYANWLDVDGIAGPATWTTLRAPGPQFAGE